jgi:hypothetical protein
MRQACAMLPSANIDISCIWKPKQKWLTSYHRRNDHFEIFSSISLGKVIPAPFLQNQPGV